MTRITIITLFVAIIWVSVYRSEDFQAALSTPTPVPIAKAGKVLGNTSTTTAILALTNKDRDVPLKQNDLLMQAAQNRAEFLCDNPFAHYGPGVITPYTFFDAVGYSYRFAGENLAKDYANPDQVEYAFMHSPTHKANIVNENYTDIGVGWACGVTVVLFGKEQ